MKNVISTICVFIITFSVSSQVKTIKGPVFKDFGNVYKIKNPDLLLEKNKIYKVIFDVYTDVDDINEINPSINTVARFINMHAQNGVKLKDMEIVLVLHGKAIKNALNDGSFKKKYKISNPNAKLLTALKKADVKTYVCAQSLIHKGYHKNDLSNDVELSLSALTALVYYQDKGYQLITFN
ncbi:MAG: DsrE family protein [Bacteroidota bacterium]